MEPFKATYRPENADRLVLIVVVVWVEFDLI